MYLLCLLRLFFIFSSVYLEVLWAKSAFLNENVFWFSCQFYPPQVSWTSRLYCTVHLPLLWQYSASLKCIAVDTWELMVIRACVMKTMDTQCGMFRYQEQTMTGCILTCDYDGCNMTSHVSPHLLLLGTAIISLIFMYCM